MVVPGNHEYLPVIGDAGKNYRTRFNMPGNSNDMYTFTLGPARFVALNTEVYFINGGGNPFKAQAQKQWLIKVLRDANLPQKRAAHPWLVVLHHRPVYCSSIQFGRCPGGASWIRKGISLLGFPGLEEIYYHHGVDLVLAGHNHHYERMFPVHNKQLKMNATAPYRNPGAPVYVVTGAGGNHEQLQNFQAPTPPWSAIQLKDFGFTKIQIFNESHLHLEQIAVEKNNSVIDEIWLIQEKHGFINRPSL
jgi:hypothetical protein